MRRITVLARRRDRHLADAAATLARAAAPMQEWISIDETFTWDDCGFPSRSTTS